MSGCSKVKISAFRIRTFVSVEADGLNYSRLMDSSLQAPKMSQCLAALLDRAIESSIYSVLKDCRGWFNELGTILVSKCLIHFLRNSTGFTMFRNIFSPSLHKLRFSLLSSLYWFIRLLPWLCRLIIIEADTTNQDNQKSDLFFNNFIHLLSSLSNTIAFPGSKISPYLKKWLSYFIHQSIDIVKYL